jgi:hypothetical protein
MASGVVRMLLAKFIGHDLGVIESSQHFRNHLLLMFVEMQVGQLLSYLSR